MGSDWNAPEGKTDRYQPSDERAPRPHGGRDTRHWCKGRIGVPHAYLWEDDTSSPYSWFRTPEWKVQHRVCFGCGRHGHGRRYICLTCGGRRQMWSWYREPNAVYTCTCEAQKPKGRPWRPQGQ